ncbi:hypothetical protein FQA47_023665 [Oryzias melastigma]|uniref:Uncharacterized protein n=1 Tax=Oryzias melastigma TaxID=30732 RepID=A0A834FPY4_ORYME|nr:hypothetical protein FQA47_023665 [Oryzias melastigma]
MWSAELKPVLPPGDTLVEQSSNGTGSDGHCLAEDGARMQTASPARQTGSLHLLPLYVEQAQWLQQRPSAPKHSSSWLLHGHTPLRATSFHDSFHLRGRTLQQGQSSCTTVDSERSRVSVGRPSMDKQQIP